MAVLWRASGQMFDVDSLNHAVSQCCKQFTAVTLQFCHREKIVNSQLLCSTCIRVLQVLHLEQMLTTGGGWQDQVGGLTPGIKVGHSKAELPLRIDMKFLAIADDTIRAFSDRLVLVYTGKTRLARNLLQV